MAVVSASPQVGLVCALRDAEAKDPHVAGSKAASLATLLGRDLPVIPGFVLTTRAHATYLAAGRTLTPAVSEPLWSAWADFTEGGRLPVVVRSSSTVEDVSSSSMAGRFRSVIDVRGWEQFLAAVRVVLGSADEVAAGSPPSPMGVLVQRHLRPSRSGVMFGVDPVTGDRSTIVVEAVSGGPDQLVSGQVTAQHYVLTRRGRLLTLDHESVYRISRLRRLRPLLSPKDVLGLAGLARRTQQVFGASQDVEWAITREGALWLLQSRPVTATADFAPATGPVLGPGPLAETFPDPLGELEIDLWVRPLREGVVEAMKETSAVDPRHLVRSPVVTTVHGRVAADLELFGYIRVRSPLGRLDPRPAIRQLGSAWRSGALTAQLPTRVADLVAETDRWLTGIEPRSSSEAELLVALRHAVDRLKRLHHHEALAGTLLPPTRTTASALALRALASEDSRLGSDELARRHPVVLSLVPPSIEEELELPPVAPATSDRPLGRLAEREQLRLRVRWVQELTVRVANELGRRLASRGLLEHHTDVGLLRLDELTALMDSGVPPPMIAERRATEVRVAFAPPLPAEFRLTDDLQVVPARRTRVSPGFGTPAGGGRGVGLVCHGSVRRPPSAGDVLVVRTLEPGLAGWLPGLAGLVAETGASLSHLAILARENGVPTVVAVHDALNRFAPGERVLVDGATGEVRAVGREEGS
ncbi:MAG TPA: PEP/pyruvate-binding domain-containing protein [Nocardioidaceae bacterium]|nr:PEP/pyruvate-binding domain-containing protein [Nocardioidaceae bacterium]